MAETDEHLYSRFLARGDSADLGVLLERHGERLTLFLYGYVRSMEDAEELMLDAFAVVAAGKSPFFGYSSFKTWIFSVGKRLALEFMRKNRLKTETVDDALPDRFTPELTALRDERRAQLYRGLAQLPTEYRQALYLLLKIWTKIPIFEKDSCFILCAFALASQSLLTSSCTVHRRKFPISHRYIGLKSLSYRVAIRISQIQRCVEVSVRHIPTITPEYAVFEH